MSARRVPLGRSKRVTRLPPMDAATRVLVPGGRVHHRDARGVLVAEDGEVATKEETELIALRLDGGLMDQIA